MTAVAELCNGERAVVFLFVCRVLYSAPLSLSYEVAALCLLTVAGLVIEISAESSTALGRFKTRYASLRNPRNYLNKFSMNL